MEPKLKSGSLQNPSSLMLSERQRWGENELTDWQLDLEE